MTGFVNRIKRVRIYLQRKRSMLMLDCHHVDVISVRKSISIVCYRKSSFLLGDKYRGKSLNNIDNRECIPEHFHC